MNQARRGRGTNPSEMSTNLMRPFPPSAVSKKALTEEQTGQSPSYRYLACHVGSTSFASTSCSWLLRGGFSCTFQGPVCFGPVKTSTAFKSCNTEKARLLKRNLSLTMARPIQQGLLSLIARSWSRADSSIPSQSPRFTPPSLKIPPPYRPLHESICYCGKTGRPRELSKLPFTFPPRPRPHFNLPSTRAWAPQVYAHLPRQLPLTGHLYRGLRAPLPNALLNSASHRFPSTLSTLRM